MGRTVVRELTDLVRQGHEIAPGTIEAIAGALDRHESPSRILEDVVWRHRGLKVAPKTVNQKRYVDAIRSQTITVGIGPAGTGKSFLAVAMAVAALSRREVNRIVLTRPAVEAGERLGFLPGDIAAKVDPYLRPLFDALYDMLEPERVNQHLERGVIEVAPLAFMRGRTLNDSFIILDEAQNTSPEQIKMFLTRLGFNSKMVVTGDVTQIDLPREQASGLLVIGDILKDVEGIEFVRFGGEDVVRHKLVQRIVAAYNEYAEKQAPALRAQRRSSRPDRARPHRGTRASCARRRSPRSPRPACGTGIWRSSWSTRRASASSTASTGDATAPRTCCPSRSTRAGRWPGRASWGTS